jgi:hypothetical protein
MAPLICFFSATGSAQPIQRLAIFNTKINAVRKTISKFIFKYHKPIENTNKKKTKTKP